MSTIKVDTVRPVTTDGSLSLKGDSGGSATTNGISIDSSGNTSVSGQLNADNIRLDGNTISSTDTNGNITLDPNGTGKIVAAAGTDWAGTVSQSSTSSIVERGSNSNGEYIKFADGTMICWFDDTVTDQAISSAYGSLYIGIRTWTYPIPFLTTPAVNCGKGKWATQAGWSGVNTSGSSSASLRFWDIGSRSAGTSMAISAMAIGRWY